MRCDERESRSRTHSDIKELQMNYRIRRVKERNDVDEREESERALAS